MSMNLRKSFLFTGFFVILFTLFLMGCGGKKSSEDALTTTSIETTTTVAPTTTVPVVPPKGYWPLTGKPYDDENAPKKPIVVAKIDNSPEARPQAGIGQADIIFEVQVEGITRLLTVFHSQAADPVGPIRSARSSDIDILHGLHTPLFAWSGGNDGVREEVREARADGILIDAGHDAVEKYYYRDNDRAAPHNLFTKISELWIHFEKNKTETPVSPFQSSFQLSGSGSEQIAHSGVETSGYRVSFSGGVHAEFVWNKDRSSWDRFQIDAAHSIENSAVIDANSSAQVSPSTVIIIRTDYVISDADIHSPQAKTTGSGNVVILTQGKRISGKWSRESSSSAFSFVDEKNESIPFAPGQIWVEVVPDYAPEGNLLSNEEVEEYKKYTK